MEEHLHDQIHNNMAESEPKYTEMITAVVDTPEIEEVIGEEGGGGHGAGSGGGGGGAEDVYVAVGKDDLEVLKWALHHAILPGARVNLIHVFPPLNSVPTPVGRLWVSQLGPEQVRVYANEEQNKRRSMLHKYIRLCLDTKVDVDTLLIESTEPTKAILDLIPVLNMTSLVMGVKHTSRRLIRGVGKGALVQKSAPEYCKVTLIYHGKKHLDNKIMIPTSPMLSLTSNSNNQKRTDEMSQAKYDQDFTQCRCFPVNFSRIV